MHLFSDFIVTEIQRGEMDTYTSFFHNFTAFNEGLELSVPIYVASLWNLKIARSLFLEQCKLCCRQKEHETEWSLRIFYSI
jgi:hypothetical protein